MDLQAELSSNGISEQEYISIIPEVGRKKKSQFEINKLDRDITDSKSRLYYYQSEVDKSKLKIANLDWIAEQKMIEIKERDLMIKQLRSKYEGFKKSIEKALRGDIDPLLTGGNCRTKGIRS